jgi:gamma-butyrobetaine dioxygenase
MLLNTIPTPDFETYKLDTAIREAMVEQGLIQIIWQDGSLDKYHFIWLRDNCACPLCIDSQTKESIYDLADIEESVTPLTLSIDNEGGLQIIWSDNFHKSVYHPGWLKTHAYSRPKLTDKQPLELWNSSLQQTLPVFDATAFIKDDRVCHAFIRTVERLGIALLNNAPTTESGLEKLASRLGLLRDMNWGKIFSIKMDMELGYIANGLYPIYPHNDGSTRERIPGIQFLQCVENTMEGGESYWVDGFYIAELLEKSYPEHYALLTTMEFEFANRDKNSHYRNKSPIIKLDKHGKPVEICDTYWLREPLQIDFELTEATYNAYRHYRRLVNDPVNRIQRKLMSGDIAVVNNRRVLHARETIIPMHGSRSIRVCFSELEEMESTRRILERRNIGLTVRDSVAKLGKF